MANITFTKVFTIPDIYSPKPSDNFLPEWYKNAESYMSGEKRPIGDGNTTATIKRCMPVFDALTSGYIIPTYVDVFISQKEQPGDTPELTTLPWYEWPSFTPIQFHSINQAPNHPNRNGHQVSYPKWMSPWAIKTPPGYSCLFIQPVHRDSKFTILSGVVDTDTYSAPVNFPFVLNDTTFEGMIPAGTPMAQVIPFKRESWSMSFGEDKEFKEQENVARTLRTKFFDSYKTQYRQVKEYR